MVHERIKPSHRDKPNNRPALKKLHKVEVDNGWNELASQDQEKKLRRHIHNDAEKQKNLARPVNQRLNNKRIKAVGLSNEPNKPENNGRISEAKIPNLANPIRTPSKEANDRIQSNVIVPPISGNRTPKAIPIKENNPSKQRQTVQARQQQEIAAAKRIADDRARRNQIAQRQVAEKRQRQTIQRRLPIPKTSSKTTKQSPQRRIVRGSSEKTPNPPAKQSRKR